jgi:uncharacterized protein (DUF342 family)
MSDEQALTRLKVETDEDGVTLYAVILSDSEGCEYTEEWLEQQLIKQNCYGVSVAGKAHEEIAELLANNKPGKIRLGEKIDAKVEVIVSRDLLSASLQITAAKGGDQAGTEGVVNALNDKKIDLKLVNKKRIVELLRKSRDIEPGKVVEVIIANGVAPEHGRDTQFECLIDGVTERKPHKREDGTLDYYDLGEILCVEEGSKLMRKYLPEPAKPGLGVTGHELQARIGKTFNFKKSKGALISPTDPNLLISAIKGQPVIADKSVSVDKLYTVKKVDLRTGHVDYDGSVVVKGDVASGMKIKVSGDVQVFGMVENATIDAGGNVDIKLGAVGHVDNPAAGNSMQISCKGNLSAAYLENITANVGGDVLIKSRVSNCEINAGYQVVVGNNRQQKSGIVGGHVTAGSIIRAEVIGSSGCALTYVNIACNADVLEQFEAIKQEIVEHDELLIRKLGLMVSASKKHTEESKRELEKLKTETEELKSRVGDLINQKDEIESSMEQARSGKIIAQKEGYPGVTVKILDQEKEIKSKYGPGTFLLFEGAMSHNSSLE